MVSFAWIHYTQCRRINSHTRLADRPKLIQVYFLAHEPFILDL